MAERYTVKGYCQLLLERSKSNTNNYPRKYAARQLGKDIGVILPKSAEEMFSLTSIKKIAGTHDAKPFTFMKEKANAYLEEAVSGDLISYMQDLGVSTYLAVKADIDAKKTGQLFLGINVNDLTQLTDIELFTTDDFQAMEDDIDELPFSLIDNTAARKDYCKKLWEEIEGMKDTLGKKKSKKEPNYENTFRGDDNQRYLT